MKYYYSAECGHCHRNPETAKRCPQASGARVTRMPYDFWAGIELLARRARREKARP